MDIRNVRLRQVLVCASRVIWGMYWRGSELDTIEAVIDVSLLVFRECKTVVIHGNSDDSAAMAIQGLQPFLKLCQVLTDRVCRSRNLDAMSILNFTPTSSYSWLCFGGTYMPLTHCYIYFLKLYIVVSKQPYLQTFLQFWGESHFWQRKQSFRRRPTPQNRIISTRIQIYRPHIWCHHFQNFDA